MKEQYEPYPQEYYMPPQQQQQSYPFPMNSPNPQDRADLLDKIKPSDIVEVFKHKLMGEVLVKGQWVKDPDLEMVSLNKRGAERISNYILAISHQNTSVSSLNDQEIKNRACRLANDAIKDMAENWYLYEIKDKSTFYMINNIIFSIALVTLKQSENEGIRDLIRGTSKWSLTPQQEDMGKKGFWSALFRR